MPPTHLRVPGEDQNPERDFREAWILMNIFFGDFSWALTVKQKENEKKISFF